MNSCYITVFTPTYNRAHTLNRVFDSLKQQYFNDFEWLIVDDGSIDNTKDLVDTFIQSADFPIRYYYKENGGRHTAINLSYRYAKGKYIINIDSDDALVADALKNIYDIWEGIPANDYDRYWCISGRCIDSKTHKMIGKPYCSNINHLSEKKKKKAMFKAGGEKSCCRKTEIIKQYPFPVFNDTKFVTENIVWERVNQRYDQYCVNDIFRIYYQNEPDSLVKGHVHIETKLNASYYAARFYINECTEQWYYNWLIVFEYVNISRLALLTGRTFGCVMKELNSWYKRILVVLGYPISWIYIKIFDL